jgi:hypothetical protein
MSEIIAQSNSGSLPAAISVDGQCYQLVEEVQEPSSSVPTLDFDFEDCPDCSNAVKEEFTLDTADLLNEFVILNRVPAAVPPLRLLVNGQGGYVDGVDYTISNGNELCWFGFGLSGVLTEGDVLKVAYY